MFKCNYENCKRILTTNKTKSFPCSACGHETMRIEEPRAHCCACGKPIYFNVSKDCDVTCDSCILGTSTEQTYRPESMGKPTNKIDIKASYLRELYDKLLNGIPVPSGGLKLLQFFEMLTSTEFKRTRDLKRTMGKFFHKHRLRGKHLKASRKAVGWTLSELANYLGENRCDLVSMESGHTKLSERVVKFIEEETNMGVKVSIPLSDLSNLPLKRKLWKPKKEKNE